MEGQEKNPKEKIPGSYSGFVFLAIAMIFLIIVIGYSFFTALTQNQLDARKQFLNKQVQFASGEIQKDFTSLYENMVFFVNNIEIVANNEEPFEELAFEKRSRRIFNNYRNIIDTLIIAFPDEIFSYHFDDQNNFIKSNHFNMDDLNLGSKDELKFFNPRNKTEIWVKVNLKRFLGSKLSSYYVGSSGEKLFYLNEELLSVNDLSSKEGSYLDEKLLNELNLDIQNGLKGEYEGLYFDKISGKDFQAIIHQYPFTLYPLENQLAVIFIQNRQLITSGIYYTYFSLFFGLLVLLVFVIIILFKFHKNTQLSIKFLAKKADEINELFRRQTLLLQETKGFIYFQDANRKMTSVSGEVENVLGYTSEDFVENYKKYISEEDRGNLDELIQRAVEDKIETITTEFYFRKPKKEVVRVKIFEKLLFDEKGKFLGNVGICTDIEDKHQSEQELKKSESRLRAVLKSLPDIIFIYDHSGIFIDYYVQDEELLISPAADSIGKSILEVLPDPINHEMIKTFTKTVETGKMQTIELELMVKMGKKIFETRLFRLDDQRIISMAREITGKRLWEKGLKEAMSAAEQANLAKSEFLANMSHEIRTPMNGLLGIIDLLDNTPLSQKQKEYLEVIKDSGNSLSGIIHDVLDYSKIESGMMPLNVSMFNLKEEIERNFKIFSALIKKKDIQMHYYFGPMMPEFIELDKEKLGQILFNLIGNAIKFTPEGGGISIHITEDFVLKNNIMLNFSIKDSGIGIPKDKFDTLTEPFVQVDGSNTREYSGTGLGLAISKKLIELMGGELHIESVENEGSTFSFTIFGTIWSDDEELSVVPSSVSLTKNYEWKGMAKKFPLNILLVEDNIINLQFMGMLMKEFGYEIEVAKDGYEALDKVNTLPFDLIFMDIQMPKMNGLEATREIRKHPSHSDIPIIGLSANAFHENIIEARAAGMDDYLTKPIRVAEIATRIQDCFQKQKKENGTI